MRHTGRGRGGRDSSEKLDPCAAVLGAFFMLLFLLGPLAFLQFISDLLPAFLAPKTRFFPPTFLLPRWFPRAMPTWKELLASIQWQKQWQGFDRVLRQDLAAVQAASERGLAFLMEHFESAGGTFIAWLKKQVLPRFALPMLSLPSVSMPSLSVKSLSFSLPTPKLPSFSLTFVLSSVVLAFLIGFYLGNIVGYTSKSARDLGRRIHRLLLIYGITLTAGVVSWTVARDVASALFIRDALKLAALIAKVFQWQPEKMRKLSRWLD